MGRVYYQTKAEVPLGPEEQLGYNPKAGYYARDKSLAQRVIGKVKPKPKPLPPVPKPPIPPKPVPKPKPAPSPRDRFVQWLRWGVAHEAEIHYAEIRPIQTYREPGHLPLQTDCSGWIILACKWAGVPDPSGHQFSGDGWSGDFYNRCEHILPRDALPGDLVVYGQSGQHHAAAIVELVAPGDFLLCSHGAEAGPRLIRHSVEARYQPSPASFLRFL